MKQLGKIVLRYSGKLILVALPVVLFAPVLATKQSGATPYFSVSIDDRCQPVHGTIHSVFTTQNCISPVGLCTAGTITGAGPLDAATTFAALTIAPSAGLPAVEPPAN